MHPWLQHSWKRAALRSILTLNLHVAPMMRRAKQEGEILSLYHAWCQKDVGFCSAVPKRLRLTMMALPELDPYHGSGAFQVRPDIPDASDCKSLLQLAFCAAAFTLSPLEYDF